MLNLEQLIRNWRRSAEFARLNQGTIAELESHLRENVEQLVRSGLTDQDAFQRAVQELGDGREIAVEFEKLEPPVWLPVRIFVALGLVAAGALFTLIASQVESAQMGLLLASHVFLVTCGYLGTFLLGALGVCFAAQHACSGFSHSRVRSLMRTTFTVGSLAAVLTFAGLILGMVWTKVEWGRYWAWDIKEIGAAAVLVWQICFLSAHRLLSDRENLLMLAGILGNAIVGFAWFGANWIAAGVAFGTPQLLLMLALALHAMLFLLGLLPAGVLHRQKLAAQAPGSGRSS